jgi:hypothetical protein
MWNGSSLQLQALTFRGLHTEHVRDRDTWLFVSLPFAQATQLWRQLGELLTDTEKHGDAEDRPAF